MTTETHPEIRASFRPDGHGGFVSRNGGAFISCPPYVIAKAASGRALELPDGYDEDTLERVMAITGWVEQDVYISGRQAHELAQIGRRILALAEGAIDPPLGYFERQSVEHLIQEVGR